MEISEIEVTARRVTDWTLVANAARMTVSKSFVSKEPSEEFKRKIIFSEHSPIRMLEYEIVIKGIPYFVSTHLVRHHIGIEKFVTTQRDDRTNNEVKREDKPQGSKVDMLLVVNAQALINISRVRLCSQASQEAGYVWNKIREVVREIDPIVAEAMQPNCIYRGFCPEMKCCGYCFTKAYQKELEDYRSGTAWANYPKNEVKYYVGWKQKKSHGDYPAPKMKMRFTASNQDEYDRNLKMETFGCEDWSVREATKEEFIKSF